MFSESRTAQQDIFGQGMPLIVVVLWVLLYGRVPDVETRANVMVFSLRTAPTALQASP